MENSQELNNTINELQNQVRKFKNISEVYAQLQEMKSDLLKLNDNSKNTYERIKFISETLDNKLSSYDKAIAELAKDNRNFQKDLEQHITSKLDKNSSDIQIAIRNEGVQIQRAMELALKENISNLEMNLVIKTNKIANQVTLFSIVTLIVVICCAIFLKYF